MSFRYCPFPHPQAPHVQRHHNGRASSSSFSLAALVRLLLLLLLTMAMFLQIQPVNSSSSSTSGGKPFVSSATPGGGTRRRPTAASIAAAKIPAVRVKSKSSTFSNFSFSSSSSSATTTQSKSIAASAGAIAASAGDMSTKRIPQQLYWPCGDALDQRLLRMALPMVANFAMTPLVGAIDLFFVNQMKEPLAVAGQAAANQVLSSIFFLTAFLPSLTATRIAQENARNNTDGVVDAIAQALFVGCVVSLASTVLMLVKPEMVLRSVLKDGAPALAYARPYLRIRSFSFVPSMISLVGFSAFRGMMDTVTPVQISLFTNLIHAGLDPVFIFVSRLGVVGAAYATLVSEVLSAMAYGLLLQRRKLIMTRIRTLSFLSLKKLQPLVRGGMALQLRNVALNLTFLAVARVVQSMDQTGVSAAAHALTLQTFQLGSIFFMALSTVAQIIVPHERHVHGEDYAHNIVVRRLMNWGWILGIVLAGLQLCMIPIVQQSSPLPEVRAAAYVPSILASVFQILNGPVFVGEGVMMGTGSFWQLSISTACATAGCVLALVRLPHRYGLSGVWMSFGVFAMVRYVGVCMHQQRMINHHNNNNDSRSSSNSSNSGSSLVSTKEIE